MCGFVAIKTTTIQITVPKRIKTHQMIKVIKLFQFYITVLRFSDFLFGKFCIFSPLLGSTSHKHWETLSYFSGNKTRVLFPEQFKFWAYSVFSPPFLTDWCISYHRAALTRTVSGSERAHFSVIQNDICHLSRLQPLNVSECSL